ncbi:MAG: YigZ family protein [Anaerolineae bacterium]|nr:YigZ family protein [Anaerolineae bacterium]
MAAALTYRRPAAIHRVELVELKSRFIGTAGRADTAEAARTFIASVRAEMPDASHHVYAFRAGYGKSVTEGMSDDGEPSGTAGPPVMAVLRGADIGDTVIVVTRYFGGTLLGTGGLVRAYGDTAREVLAALPTELNIPKITVGLEMPYPLFNQVKRLIAAHEGVMDDESFTDQVALIVTFPETQLGGFTAELRELTAGQVVPLPF